MNIILTTNCNLDCSYCFARSLRTAQAPGEMSMDELDTLIHTLDPARDPVRLMGGEPTLHSQYRTILKTLKRRGFKITVFTNGIHPNLRRSTPHLPDKILLNLNDWLSYSSAQQTAIQTNLSALGERINLAYTILQPDFDLSMHCQFIIEQGLHPLIRLGLAQPVVGGDNAYLADTHLPAAHRSVVRWAKSLAEDGIHLSLDCGFMQSHFSNADIETLVRAGTALKFNCVPTVDVGPGLQVWRCFAFSNTQGISWKKYQHENKLREWFISQEPHLHNNHDINYNRYQDDWDQGGCLARKTVNIENKQGVKF